MIRILSVVLPQPQVFESYCVGLYPSCYVRLALFECCRLISWCCCPKFSGLPVLLSYLPLWPKYLLIQQLGLDIVAHWETNTILLYLPRVRTSFGNLNLCNFYYHGGVLWNQVDSKVYYVSNLLIFRTKYICMYSYICINKFIDIHF